MGRRAALAADPCQERLSGKQRQTVSLCWIAPDDFVAGD